MSKPIDPEKMEIVMRAECPECHSGQALVCTTCGGSGRVTWGVPMRDFLEQVFGALEVIRKERGG